MGSMLLRVTAVALCMTSYAPVWAAEPVPKIAPAPAWVTPSELPVPPKASEGPIQFLLSSSQERVFASGIENYVEYAAIPLNAAGLQALGNIIVPWNIARADLTIHKVAIRRAGKDVDVLKASDVMVMRRENNLEKAILDGIRTVVIPAKGLEVGDTLNVAFSYVTRASEMARRPEEIQTLAGKIHIQKVERRFLVPDDVKIAWKIAPAVPLPAISKSNGVADYRFSATDVQPLKVPSFAPGRYKQPIIQLSGYSSWSDIANQMVPLFKTARRLRPNSPLIGETAKIAAESQDPGKRLLGALRLAQDRVRYVALLLGDGAYVPSSADETWERRFGDCKGKVAVLLALLDELGIVAEPMLVSNDHDDRLAEHLPSLFMFDHVIVRARIGSTDYFLDPTDYGQRTLNELRIPTFSHGLPLRNGGMLEPLSQGSLDAPVREVWLTWDATRTDEGKYPFEATLTLRGSVAATMRAKLAAETEPSKVEKDLKDMVPNLENDALLIVDKNPEASDGTFVVKFKGTAPMDWSPFEGKRETRYSFSNATVRWDANFDREEGPGRDWPVFLAARPYWERLTETVILPDGGKGYSVEANEVDKTVAGSVIQRTTRIEGGRAITVSDFRHVRREISAQEARSATPILEGVAEDYAYIIGPPERKRQANN